MNKTPIPTPTLPTSSNSHRHKHQFVIKMHKTLSCFVVNFDMSVLLESQHSMLMK